MKPAVARPVSTIEAMPTAEGLTPYVEEALSQVSEAIVAIDHEGRVQFMNRAAELISGHIAENTVARLLATVLSIVDVVSGADFAQAIEQEQRAPTADGAYRRAILLGGKDSPTVIDYRVRLVKRGTVATAGSVIVFRDVMKLRHSEQALEVSAASHQANAAALHEERERARVTLNSIGDAVISTDFRGRVIFLNPIAEKLTGWELDRAIARPLVEVFPLVESESRTLVTCPAMRAIIQDDTCRSGNNEVLIRNDGSEIAVDHSASPIHDASGGVIGVVVVAHDVTAARNQADGLTRLALYDALTDLPNRTLLADRLAHALHGTQRNDRVVAVLFVDLDGFKTVNDTDGHATGDKLLQQVARRLLACVRSTDTVSRHGGDEFVILLPDLHSGSDAEVCARSIVAALREPFAIGAQLYRIGASVGIAAQPTSSGDTLLKHADIAMYHAKSAGRNRVSRFSPDMLDDSSHCVSPRNCT